MKALLFSLFALFALISQASAKACFQSKAEMIHSATVIAIITIENVEKFDGKELEQGLGKHGKAKLETLIKGDIRDDFTIVGDELRECGSCPIVEGRYLAFLRPYGSYWAGCNWHLSLRPIDGDKVMWYKNDEKHQDIVARDLKTAIEEIREELASRTYTEPMPKHFADAKAVCWKLAGRRIDEGVYTAEMLLINPTSKPVIFRGWTEQRPCYRLQTLKDDKWVETDVDWIGDKDLRACTIAPGQSALIKVATRLERIPVRVGLAYSTDKKGKDDQVVWSDPIAK